MRTVALAASGLLVITACTGHTSSHRSAAQSPVQRQATLLPCGGERVRVTVGSSAVVLDSLKPATVVARRGDTLTLSGVGPCDDSVHLYERGGLIATDSVHIQLTKTGRRVFGAEIPMCAHRPSPCFGGLRSLGSIEVNTR
jgi:hypothetical protein